LQTKTLLEPERIREEAGKALDALAAKEPQHASRETIRTLLLPYRDQMITLRSRGYSMSALQKALAERNVYVSLITIANLLHGRKSGAKKPTKPRSNGGSNSGAKPGAKTPSKRAIQLIETPGYVVPAKEHAAYKTAAKVQ
jgi:hypothetical protein